MFNKIKKKATQIAEHTTGVDLDGDGVVGDGSGRRIDPSSLASIVSSMTMKPDANGKVKLDDGYALPVSTCTGNKKALLVGINYKGTNAELRGCINDVVNIKKLITQKFGFKDDSEHMMVLTDDQQGKNAPTKENMIKGMKWLIANAKDGDSLFFHYSGHGGTQADTDGDEADGTDETLIPSDYQTNGVIVDDEIHALLVAPLPRGVRVTAVMDCCHSGSVFDLPYTYKVDGTLDVVEVDNRKIAISNALKAGKLLIDGNKLSAAKLGASTVMSLMKKNPPPNGKPVVVKQSLADVIQFSGCKDEQTSADACIDGARTGAMSWALITVIEEFGLNQTYTELLKNIRTKLEVKYSQIPQMSTGHKMNMAGTKFIM